MNIRWSQAGMFQPLQVWGSYKLVFKRLTWSRRGTWFEDAVVITVAHVLYKFLQRMQ